MIISRQEAKQQNLKYYFTGKACKYGHTTNRYVGDKACVLCAKQKAKTLRSKVIEHLGGCCKRCKFSDARALQIDHVNGGGTAEYRSLGSSAVYRKVLKDTTNMYQLLCANCNWIKRDESVNS